MNPTVDPSRLLKALGLDPGDVELTQVPLAVERASMRLASGWFEIGLPVPGEWPGTRLFGRLDENVFELRATTAPSRTLGVVEKLSAGRWLLDARRSPACAIIEDRIFLSLPEGLTVGRIRPSQTNDDESSALVTSLLEGRSAPGWLLKEATVLIRKREPYPRAAGVGLVGRLWTPSADARLEISKLLAANGPAPAAQRWFSLLPIETRDLAAEQACHQAEQLRGDLPPLECLATRRPRAPELTSWIFARDDLESFAFLLGVERPGSDLELLLHQLDRETQNYFSVFSQINLAHEPRIRNVVLQEPELWWGRLAEV